MKLKCLNSNALSCQTGPIFPSAGILLPNITDDQIEHIGLRRSTSFNFIPVLNASQSNLTSVSPSTSASNFVNSLLNSSRPHRRVLIKLSALNKSIAGVIIVNYNGSEKPFDALPRSDDVTCPNENVTDRAACYHWIDRADDTIGAFFRHWPFAMFYLEDSNVIDSITKVYALFK